MYAHFFPQHTRSLILEGVVSGGWDAYSDDKFSIHLFQRYFDSLPSAIRKIILSETIGYVMKPSWLPSVIRSFIDSFGTESGLNRLTEIFQQSLELVRNGKAVTFKSAMNEVVQKPTVVPAIHASPLNYYTDDFVTAVLDVKEFAADKQESTRDLIFDGWHFKKAPYNFFANVVKRYQLPSGENIYRASEYPVTIPTYYFQGTRDVRTIPWQAVQHWKTVPQNQSYLLLLREGGHIPTEDMLPGKGFANANDDQASFFFSNVFLKALRAQEISDSDVAELKKRGNLRFSFAQRASKSVRCESLFSPL